jgi:lysophosphatidylcholine acyltransferase/lyso-PAF acetyltransferase
LVTYPHKHFSPTWESISGLTHIFRLLTQVYNSVEVNWLPVYYPSAAEQKDPKLYANNVRKLLSEASKTPIMESSFADKIDYHTAIGRRKPSPTPSAASPSEAKKDD